MDSSTRIAKKMRIGGCDFTEPMKPSKPERQKADEQNVVKRRRQRFKDDVKIRQEKWLRPLYRRRELLKTTLENTTNRRRVRNDVNRGISRF